MLFPSEHESVTYCNDPQTGLKAIIAIHSTLFGPACGGTRIFPYTTEEEALADALELSRAMTYKATAADLPFGGAKAVIISDPNAAGKQHKLQAFCRFVNMFSGTFQTGEDMGTDREDIIFMQKFSPYAHCSRSDQEYLETSALTMRGILSGIHACFQYRFGMPDVASRKIAIQGLGKVGGRLAEALSVEGAQLFISDVNRQAVARLSHLKNCVVVAPEEIYSVEADLFSPCALGHTLNRKTVSLLKTQIVAGCANNQLEDDSIAGMLFERAILYAPDYVINAGGLISAMLEMQIEEEAAMLARIDQIGSRLISIFTEADAERLSTLEIANRRVRQKLSIKNRL